ncbi:MAG: flagellar hook capping protein [Ignavibacteria bacterium]|nr:flagellar hook capping protein [Ignavibacteria bacterium]
MPQRIVNQSFPTTQTETRGTPGTLGKNDFLKLLVGQMKYQDPLNPMKGTEFTAQLAQFSGLEQLQNMNDNLQESMSTNYILTSSINNALASNFVGKNVKAASDQFYWQGGNGMRLGYNLTKDYSKVTVKIYDESDNLIREFRGGNRVGENVVVWDGKDDNHGIVDEGIYRFEIEDSEGRNISAQQFMFGKINSVRYDQNGTVFLVDGIEVRLSDILEVSYGG